jgi:hypothetical protein
MNFTLPRSKTTVNNSKERKKDVLTPLDQQIAKAITKPGDLESEIFEMEEMHSAIDKRYSELTTFIAIKPNELKLKVTVQ